MSFVDVSTLCRFLPRQSFSFNAKCSPRTFVKGAALAMAGLMFFSHTAFAIESSATSPPAARSDASPASASAFTPASTSASTLIGSASAANVSAANLSPTKAESAANERIPTITIIGKRMTEKQTRAWDQAHPQ